MLHGKSGFKLVLNFGILISYLWGKIHSWNSIWIFEMEEITFNSTDFTFYWRVLEWVHRVSFGVSFILMHLGDTQMLWGVVEVGLIRGDTHPSCDTLHPGAILLEPHNHVFLDKVELTGTIVCTMLMKTEQGLHFWNLPLKTSVFRVTTQLSRV